VLIDRRAAVHPIEFTGVDASVLPTPQSAASSRTPAQRVPGRHGFARRPGRDGPATERAEVQAYAERVRALPGAAAVAPLADPVRDVWRIDVVPRGPELGASAKELVRDIRQVESGLTVAVGGETADFLDQQSSLRAHLPYAIGLLAVTTLVILFLMTGSVVLPVKTLVMNLLTLSAAFGLLVLIFQDGRLEGLLAFDSQGALESTQPILLFAIAFGLSTDYGVFLLTRIKEARDAGASDTEAVALGLERTGRIVTAAALLFCIAIGAFATSEIIFIKQVGVGTALAVLIDATIVRALLVPALMKLLGEPQLVGAAAAGPAPRPLRAL
jgi:RND superfamily putative drug exporter